MANKIVEQRLLKYRPDYYSNKSVCSWIEEYEKDVYKDYLGAPCHAQLGGESIKGKAKAIHLLLQPRNENDLPNATRYFEYLCSPDAPWAAVKPTLTYDAEGRPWYISHPVEKGQPQLYYFFAILTRTPYEQFGGIHSFAFFRDNGFDDVKAMYMSAFLHMSADYEKTWMCGSPGAHYAWDWTYKSPISLKRLIDKNPNLRGDGRCSDSAAIWTDLDYKKPYELHQYGRGTPFDYLQGEDKYEGAYLEQFKKSHGTNRNLFPAGGYPTGIELIKRLREKEGEWGNA